MRLAPTALVLALCCSTLAATAPAEAARGARCGGSKVTIESNDRTVVGSEGPDVILAVGSRDIRGGGGDDRICLVSRGRSARIDAGTGDDTVRIVRGGGTNSVTLGEGDDVFIGGDGQDRVVGFSDADHAGADDVRTRGGDDFVWRASGAAGDEVALGGGDDWLTFDGAPDTVLLPDGGAGSDRISLLGGLGSPGALVVDNRTQAATIDGTTFARWEDFERFTMQGGDSQAFRGTGEDEEVHLGDEFQSGQQVSAAMGGGDDRTSLWEIDAGEGGALVGGRGTDLIVAAWLSKPEGAWTGSLRTQRVDFISADDSGSLTFTGMEGLEISVPGRITVLGDGRDNVLSAFGCEGLIKGGGGDDEMQARGFWDDLDQTCTPRITMRGGGGDDDMVGSGGPDRLVGGRGRDFADGGPLKGPDVCRAEVERRCER